MMEYEYNYRRYKIIQYSVKISKLILGKDSV